MGKTSLDALTAASQPASQSTKVPPAQDVAFFATKMGQEQGTGADTPSSSEVAKSGKKPSLRAPVQRSQAEQVSELGFRTTVRMSKPLHDRLSLFVKKKQIEETNKDPSLPRRAVTVTSVLSDAVIRHLDREEKRTL